MPNRKGVSQPNKRAPRRPWPVERGTTVHINSNVEKHTLEYHRVQYLIVTAGVSAAVASLLSPLIFGGAA